MIIGHQSNKLTAFEITAGLIHWICLKHDIRDEKDYIWALRGPMEQNLNLTSGNDVIKWVYRFVGPLAASCPSAWCRCASVMATLAKTWIHCGQKGCDQDPRQITTAPAHQRPVLTQMMTNNQTTSGINHSLILICKVEGYFPWNFQCNGAVLV